MNCGEFRERIDDYMDGLLDEALHARMDAHACECTQCSGLLKQAMEIKAALADLDDEAPVPAEVSAAWRRAVKLEAERRRLLAELGRLKQGKGGKKNGTGKL